MSALRARAAQALGWVLGSLAGARLVNLAATVVLARLLVPDDFGVLAVPLLVLTYLDTAGDLGTGAALIQRDEDREGAALVSFGAGLVLSLPWAVATWWGADAIAGFFDRPDVADAIRILAFSFPLKALGNTHDALLQHELRFGRRTVAEQARALVKAAVSIVLALLGHGPWSLVWGQLAGTAAWVVALWILSPWRPWAQLGGNARARAAAAMRPMLSFGLQVVVVNVLAALLHHLDKVLVGRVAGVTTLGLYAVAARLPETAVTTLTWAVGRVAFPAFSRSQGDLAARQQVYRDALRLVSLTAVPSGVGLFVLATPVVLLAFGADWRDAAAPMGWLALTAVFRALASHAGDLMKGVGRADLLRNLAFLKAAVVLPALFLGARTGQAARIALALAVAALINGLVSTLVASKLLAVPARQLARAAAPGLVAGAVMGGAVAALGLVTASWSPALDLALRVPVGLVVFVATAGVLSPDLVAWCRARLAAHRSAEATP